MDAVANKIGCSVLTIVNVCLHRWFCVYIRFHCLHPSIFLSVHLLFCVSINHSVYPYFCLRFFLSIHVSVYLSVRFVFFCLMKQCSPLPPSHTSFLILSRTSFSSSVVIIRGQKSDMFSFVQVWFFRRRHLRRALHTYLI